MAIPSSNQYFEANHQGPGTPADPNLFTAAEMVAGSFDSGAISTATSAAVSTVNAAAPDSTSISQARSQAVSAASVGSIADSKAISDSSNISVVDSKSSSNSVNISIADSKAVSGASYASTLSTRAGGSLYAVMPGELGVTDPSYPYGHLKRYGGLASTLLDNSTALNAVQAAAAITGAYKVYVPGATTYYRVQNAVPWVAGISFKGDGWDRTVIKFDGAINGFTSSDTSYVRGGTIEDMTIAGINGALDGVSPTYRTDVRLVRVYVSGFTQRAVYLNNTIMGKLDQCLFTGNGSASFAQVEVENSTTFLWDHSYISTGNAGVVAGLAIDKTTSYTILGGAVESSGINIRLCGKADATTGTNVGYIAGIDLENPNGTADTYIELGAGWSGAANQGVTRLTIGGVNESPSGSSTVKYGIKAQNTDTVTLLPNKWGTPAFASGGVSNIELVGTTNIRWSATQQSSSLGAGLIHVRENSVARADALPQTSWEQGGRNLVVTRGTTFALNSATPDATGISLVGTNSSVATSITRITGGYDGQLLLIVASDSNTTLKHNSGGVGNITLLGGVDWLMGAGNAIMLAYESSTTTWRHIASPASTLGAITGTGNYLTATTSSGQQSLVATGTDATVSVNITPKGAGFVKSNISSQFAAHRVGAVASGNWLDLFPNVAGSPPRVVADGADTDIDLKLEPKGAGVVNINLPATIAAGGGAASTNATIGGSGPTGAAAVGWLKVKVNGSIRFLQLWA